MLYGSRGGGETPAPRGQPLPCPSSGSPRLAAGTALPSVASTVPREAGGGGSASRGPLRACRRDLPTGGRLTAAKRAPAAKPPHG